MKLYDIDYSILPDEEKKLWEEIQEQEIVWKDGKATLIRHSLYHKYPRAARQFQTLFPNNFIDFVDLHNSEEEHIKLLENFSEFIANKNVRERDILNFIRIHKAYFIISGILENYTFGHHALYLFPEFQLPPNYQADFLLIGANSHGHHFVFVELESVYGEIVLQDGSFGNSIRKGIKQIDDWEIWLEQNFSSIKTVLSMYKNKEKDFPKEFVDFDKSRIHHVVVAGTRKDFNDKTNRLRRNSITQRQLTIMHYDNLIEQAKRSLTRPTY